MADLLVPVVAGGNATAAQINAAFDVTRLKFQVSDQTANNTTTMINSTYLVFAVAASSTYVFEGNILYDSSTTADFKGFILCPSGTTGLMSPWGSDTAAASATSTIQHDTSTSFLMTYGGIGIGTVMSARPSAVINISTASGNVVFQFAQNTASAVNTRLVAGSWIRLTKVT